MEKSKKKHYFSGGYESQIKISLILLIGFLLSLNFISAYSLGKARLAQQNDYNLRMKLALNLIQENIKSNFMYLPDASYLNDIINQAGVDEIEIFDSLSNQLIDIRSSRTIPVENRIINSVTVTGKNDRTVYHIFASGVNSEGANLKRLALFDTIFRISGLIVGLFVAYFFIRSVLNPYRKIKKEAKKVDLSRIGFDDVDSVEYAVRMFQEVIRELKQKETLLQAMYNSSEKRADSLARYNEYILGSISSGVIICDNQGIITRFNHAAEKIIGFNQQYSQGRHYSEVFGKKHHIAKIFDEALNNNNTFSRKEFEIPRKNNENLWIGLSSSLISDNSNNKIGAAALLTDLTKIKKLQEISDFTEKMAALGEMSAGLAHELRNSVAAILGFGKLLKKILPSEKKAASIAQMIISESLATEEMLSRFLNFTRPLKVVPAKIAIRQLLDESINMALEMHQDKKINVNVDDRSDGLPINGDPILLKNALNNLIINACQAVDKSGKINVRVDYDNRDNQLKILISDTGRGISKANLPKIFNPFFSTRDKGTGLGLSLVQKIITGHLGNIEVESKEGEGAAFTITLPVDLKIEQTDEDSAKQPEKKSLVPEVFE